MTDIIVIDENDQKPANIGLHTSTWWRAQDRADWRNFVKTATLNYRDMLLMMILCTYFNFF